jgi:Flp pilus assembly protein TadG
MSSPGALRGGRQGRGQSLVEFSMILPIFLLILAGLLDYGFMLFARMNLINAAREGARWAVVQPDVTQIPSSLQSQSGAIGANLAGLRWADLVTPTIVCVPDPSIAGNTPCEFVNDGLGDGVRLAGPRDFVQVQTTYTYHSFFARIFGTTIPLSTRVEMPLEVPD